MKLVKVVLLFLLVLGLSGCIGGQLKIDVSPGFLFSVPIHWIKILNGTSHELRVIGTKITIDPGGQADIPYPKSRYSRKIVLSVVAVKEEQAVGWDMRKLTIPSYRRSPDDSEEGWPVRRLKPIQ